MKHARWRTLIVGALAGLLALALLGSAAAQGSDPDVVAQARVDRHELRVGDLLSYDLTIAAPAGFEVSVPEMPSKTWGEWEVRSCQAQPADSDPSDGTTTGWSCVLTVWTVGDHEVPTLEVAYSQAGQEGSTRTQALTVTVVTVLDEAPEDIKPLKPQLVMDDPANLLLIVGLVILALLVAGAIALAVVYYRRNRPQRAPVPVAAPILDASGAALQELERIAKLGLIAEGRIAEHYDLIADTLRRYIDQRYRIPALLRTTREIRSELGAAPMTAHEMLVSLLNEADGVKFARYLPDATQASQMIERARRAVLESR